MATHHSKVKRSFGLFGSMGWVLLFFFVNCTFYAILNNLGNQDLHLSSSGLRNPRITIFAAPRPFSSLGEELSLVDLRQDMAVRSWLAISPDVSVVLFGQHPSIFAFAKRLGSRVSVESAIDFTFQGTPFFNSMVARSQATDSDISVLIDPEIILLPDFLTIFNYAQKMNNEWFLVSLPRYISSFPLRLTNKSKHWIPEDSKIMTEKLQENFSTKEKWSTCGEKLIMAWNKGITPLFVGVLPPFVFGEGFHNEWLVNEVLSSELRYVFDASMVVSSFFPQSFDILSEKSTPNATSGPERTMHHRVNYHLATSYGSLPLNQSMSYTTPAKLVTCSGEYYMANLDNNVYILQRIDGHNSYNLELQSLSGEYKRTSLFTRFLYSQSNKKWRSCLEGTESLDKEYRCHTRNLLKDSSREEPLLSLPLSLESLLKIVADENRSVVVAVAGYSYKEMLMSWICRLRQLDVKNFIVYALDSDMYQYAVLQGLPVFEDSLAPSNISFDGCHFGSKCFQRVTKVKSRIVLKILKLGYNVLMSDVDVYWFKNPLPFLHSYGPAKILAQSDEFNETGPINLPRRLNSGFYFVRNDLASISAMEMVVHHASSSELSEQPSFYDVLCGEGGINRRGDDQCQEPHTNLTVIFLNRDAFPNGAYKGLWETKDVRLSCLKLGCYILHNNWIRGRKRKLERHYHSGLLQYDPSSRMCIQEWHDTNSISYL